jgi:hypothetical protein
MARSATGVTAVVAVAVLFAGVGSGSLAVTVAVLVMVVPPAAAVGVTWIVTVALAPLARVPNAQVTVVLLTGGGVQAPWLGVAETKVTFAGSVSVTVTPVAGEGPALLAVSV